MARSGKFYRKNEAEVMRKLGLNPTKNSGSGWIEKEDGQNDYVIAQLKSTDASSIKVNLRDIEVLEYNAAVAKKIPLFVLDFIQSGELLLLVKPNDIVELAKYIETGTCKPYEAIELADVKQSKKEPTVKSSSAKSRNKFYEEAAAKYKKKRG